MEPGLARRHRAWGWTCLALFAGVGLVLESLHGFKLAAYLDHETRRTMWRLAHAHGAMLGLVHLAYAAQLDGRPIEHDDARRRARAVSWALGLAALLMPAGFFLGGMFFHEGDPGLGVALVPLGGIALIYACLRLAWASLKRPSRE